MVKTFSAGNYHPSSRPRNISRWKLPSVTIKKTVSTFPSHPLPTNKSDPEIKPLYAIQPCFAFLTNSAKSIPSSCVFLQRRPWQIQVNMLGGGIIGFYALWDVRFAPGGNCLKRPHFLRQLPASMLHFYYSICLPTTCSAYSNQTAHI